MKKRFLFVLITALAYATVYGQDEAAETQTLEEAVTQEEPVSAESAVQESTVQEPTVSEPVAQEPAVPSAPPAPPQTVPRPRSGPLFPEADADGRKLAPPPQPVVQEPAVPRPQPAAPSPASAVSEPPTPRREQAVTRPEPAAPRQEQTAARSRPAPQNKPKRTPPKFSIGAGGLLNSDFGGGISTPAEDIEMPYMGFGGFLFLDFRTFVIQAGYSSGGGDWKSSDKPDPIIVQPEELLRESFSIGAYAKIPFELGPQKSITFYLLAGGEYEITLSGKLKLKDGREIEFDGGVDKTDLDIKRPDADVLNSLWFKGGAGLDVFVSQIVFLRAEFLYGARLSNKFEDDYIKNAKGGDTKLGHGMTVKVGVGAGF